MQERLEALVIDHMDVLTALAHDLRLTVYLLQEVESFDDALDDEAACRRSTITPSRCVLTALPTSP
jgi:hypothetical protein